MIFMNVHFCLIILLYQTTVKNKTIKKPVSLAVSIAVCMPSPAVLAVKLIILPPSWFDPFLCTLATLIKFVGSCLLGNTFRRIS